MEPGVELGPQHGTLKALPGPQGSTLKAVGRAGSPHWPFGRLHLSRSVPHRGQNFI